MTQRHLPRPPLGRRLRDLVGDEKGNLVDEAEMQQVLDSAVVRLQHGSVITLKDLNAMSDEIKALEAERDRARRLAAHLEEVVAMRNNVLEALVGWEGVATDGNGRSLYDVIDWAKAQLEEVP